MLQVIETPYKIVAITAATTFALCSLMELYRRKRTRKKDSRMTNVDRSIDENVRIRRGRPKCWSELPEIALGKIFSQFTWKELIEIRKVCPRWKVFIEEHGLNTIEGKKKMFHFNWFYENPEVTTWSKHLDIQPEFISSKTCSAPVALFRDQQDGTQVRVIEKAGNDWAVWPIDLGEDVGECAHVTDQLIIIGSCGEGFNDFTLHAWDRRNQGRIWKRTYPRRRGEEEISGLFSACKSSILILNENLFEVVRFGRRNMTLTPTTVTYEMDFKFSSHYNTSKNLQFHDPYVLMYYYHEEVAYVGNDGVNVWDGPTEWIVLKVDDRTKKMSLIARIDDDLFLSRFSPDLFTADATFSYPHLITAVDLEMIPVDPYDPYSDDESEPFATKMSKLEVYDVVLERSIHKEYRRGEHISLAYCDGKIVSVTGSINKKNRVGKKELKVLDIQQLLNKDKINNRNQIVLKNTQTLNLSGKEKVYNRKDFVNDSSYFEIICGEEAKSVRITKLGWEGK